MTHCDRWCSPAMTARAHRRFLSALTFLSPRSLRNAWTSILLFGARQPALAYCCLCSAKGRRAAARVKCRSLIWKLASLCLRPRGGSRQEIPLRAAISALFPPGGRASLCLAKRQPARTAASLPALAALVAGRACLSGVGELAIPWAGAWRGFFMAATFLKRVCAGCARRGRWYGGGGR